MISCLNTFVAHTKFAAKKLFLRMLVKVLDSFRLRSSCTQKLLKNILKILVVTSPTPTQIFYISKKLATLEVKDPPRIHSFISKTLLWPFSLILPLLPSHTAILVCYRHNWFPEGLTNRLSDMPDAFPFLRKRIFRCISSAYIHMCPFSQSLI